MQHFLIKRTDTKIMRFAVRMVEGKTRNHSTLLVFTSREEAQDYIDDVLTPEATWKVHPVTLRGAQAIFNNMRNAEYKAQQNARS
jgi:hypothetical protein